MMMYRSKERVQSWFLLFAILVIAAARLMMTGDRDILALNSPHDDYWFIQTVLKRIWSGPYTEMSFIKLAVYPAWLVFIDLFGIPARLAIDLLWLLATGYLALALYHLSKKWWLGTLLFAYLAFHPATISYFDRALAEGFLTVISAGVIGAGIELWNCRKQTGTVRKRFAPGVFALGFAIAYHTRSEGVVLAVPLLFLAVLSLFAFRTWWLNGSRSLAIPFLIMPVILTVILGAMLSGANFLKWGVWARYDLEATQYKRTIAALNSIDTGRTPLHVTVTMAALELGYRESPTFRELKPFMEGRPGRMWIAISEKSGTVPAGEIGNGFFCWALRDAAAQAGWHSSATAAEKKYGAVADELGEAFAAGRLERKGIMLFSFLDPDITKWLPGVPSSVLNVTKLVIAPEFRRLKLLSENATPIQFDQYTTVTGRRTLLSRSVVAGWANLPAGTRTEFRNGGMALGRTQLSGPERPDVAGAYGFHLVSSRFATPTELVFVTPDGRQGSIPLDKLKRGNVAELTGELSGRIGIDQLTISKRTRKADRWLPILCTAYRWIGYFFSLIAATVLLALLFRRINVSGALIMFFALAVAAAARILLFGIIDASSWNGLQVRYLLPVMPAFACMGALGLMLLLNLVQSPSGKTLSEGPP